MIRLSKLTDYGFVLLTRFASAEAETSYTARDLAESTGLPLPTVSKLLKIFSKGGVLTAHRGVHGGYRLARPADLISAADVIEVVDGPLAITECACEGHAEDICAIEEHCPTKPHWIQITERIRAALADVTLLEMSKPVRTTGAFVAGQAEESDCRGGNCNSISGEPCTCGDHLTHFPGDKK